MKYTKITIVLFLACLTSTSLGVGLKHKGVEDGTAATATAGPPPKPAVANEAATQGGKGGEGKGEWEDKGNDDGKDDVMGMCKQKFLDEFDWCADFEASWWVLGKIAEEKGVEMKGGMKEDGTGEEAYFSAEQMDAGSEFCGDEEDCHFVAERWRLFLDHNGDGKVQLSEVKDFMHLVWAWKCHGCSDEFLERGSAAFTGLLFANADKNEDGKLQAGELAAFCDEWKFDDCPDMKKGEAVGPEEVQDHFAHMLYHDNGCDEEGKGDDGKDFDMCAEFCDTWYLVIAPQLSMADLDGNGKFDGMEAGLIREHGCDGDEKCEFAIDHWELFLDHNNDGEVEWSEVKDFVHLLWGQHCHGCSEEFLGIGSALIAGRIFELSDANEDGMIDQKEMAGFCMKFNLGNEEDCKREAAEKGGDGPATFDDVQGAIFMMLYFDGGCFCDDLLFGDDGKGGKGGEDTAVGTATTTGF